MIRVRVKYENFHVRRNTRHRLYFRGFRGILSGHVSIGWIPDTFLFEVHSRRATRMDFTVEGWRGTAGEDGIIDVTNVLVHDSYFLAHYGRSLLLYDGKFFNFQARKLESRRYHPKGCVPLAGKDMGEGHVTLIQEPCPCKWV